MYCLLELCTPFNCCKCAVFNTRTFSRLFFLKRSKTITDGSVSCLGVFTNRNDRSFPYILKYFNWLDPYPFIGLKLGKLYPFQAELPCIKVIIGSTDHTPPPLPPPPPLFLGVGQVTSAVRLKSPKQEYLINSAQYSN